MWDDDDYDYLEFDFKGLPLWLAILVVIALAYFVYREYKANAECETQICTVGVAEYHGNRCLCVTPAPDPKP